MDSTVTMYYLGIDPSLSNTAAVLLSSTGDILGVGNSKNRNSALTKNSDNFEILRIAEIACYVSELISALLPTTRDSKLVIGYENYSFGSTNRAFSLGELGGVLKVMLLKHSDTLTLVEPTTLKKFATWKGRVQKSGMMEQALVESKYLRDLPKKHFTDDVADAYFLAKYVWYYHAPEAAAKNEQHTNFIRRRIELCQKAYGKAKTAKTTKTARR